MNAYMSMQNLMMNNANFETEGKLATLWFDELLLPADDSLIRSVINDVAQKEKWSKDTLNEVLKIQVTSTKLVPRTLFSEDIVNDSKFEASVQIYKEHYRKELASSDTYAGAMHEITWASAGTTDSVKYWMLLNAKERCTFLPMTFERQLLQKIFVKEGNAQFSNFSNIISSFIPDITEYSWDEIIDLRCHPYWVKFRAKLSELSDENLDPQIAREIFNEVLCKDMTEMVQNMKPQIGRSIIKGTICNIPLPIPINPISVICTGRDILKEIDFKKKYGWLFFYFDNKK